MSRYADVVFLQGSDYYEAEQYLLSAQQVDPESWDAEILADYMALWDHGEYEDWHEEPCHGPDDRAARVGDYLVSWNHHYGYMGMERVSE